MTKLCYDFTYHGIELTLRARYDSTWGVQDLDVLVGDTDITELIIPNVYHRLIEAYEILATEHDADRKAGEI